MVVFIVFIALLGLTGWSRLRQKTIADWLLDGAGLWVQGLVIPLLQLTLLHTL